MLFLKVAIKGGVVRPPSTSEDKRTHTHGYYRHSHRPRQCFSGCVNPRTNSLSITSGLLRNVTNKKFGGGASGVSRLTSPPGESDAGHSLRTTGLGLGNRSRQV